jgi:multiple sugar transport system substrate-binding protein
MKNLSPFQTILLVASGVIIIVGVSVFAFSKANNGKDVGNVVIWGTIAEADFTAFHDYLKSQKKMEQTIEYRFIEPAEFDTTFTTALAEGLGPDLVLITDDKIVRHENKLFQISYEFYPERLFKDNFIEAGEIFTDERGVFAFPFLVDPIVMYWNRSFFTEKGLSQPPKFWDELLTMAPQLVETELDLSLRKSAVAMGDYGNIKHAKQILTTLLMQAGNDIVLRNSVVDPAVPLYTVIFDESMDFTASPSQAAVNFYTQFANPSRTVYSWNRSLPNSLDAFIAGDVAMYFGFASEFSTVRQKNPNLNFDVAVIPQSRSGTRATYGKVLALAIPKTTPNVERAFSLIRHMTESNANVVMADVLFLPPVKRDLLGTRSENAFMQTFHDSALISKNVYDFNPEETDKIFQRLIESVVSGRLTTSEAVVRTSGELNALKP